MAYAAPFIRLSFGGGIADNNDIWSCGLALDTTVNRSDDSVWFANTAAKLPAVGTIISSFVSNADTRVPNNAKLFWAKMALIGTDGKYMEEAVELQLNSGGARNVGYSPQDALVMGLQSDKWKDPGKNNRFYLPTVATSDVNGWKLSATEQNAVATQLANFVEALNTALIGEGDNNNAQVFVVSDSGTGYRQGASQVRVGAIVDTQRRRRNKLNEDYVVIGLGE